MGMAGISTHVLDSALGRPAAGIAVTLRLPDGSEHTDTTDVDGRITALHTGPVVAGVHRLTFAVAAYHAATGQESFFPEIVLAFTPDPARGHHHVPLLLSPFAYTTYRGS